MSSRIQSLTKLVPELESALKTFQTSDSKFRILRTIRPNQAFPQDAAKLSSDNESSPKTLFILDSSFNPPSVAHETLAQSALHKSTANQHPKPHRLLLLFAVMNADKAPSPASFQQRLSMMTIFARDLQDSFSSSSDQDVEAVPIDIGVTTAPYYTDKSRAIETEGSEWYPDQPKHIHLVGYDTLTRFFAAKYYREKFDPPFSALDPYFSAGHWLRVTLRPDHEYGSVEEQKSFAEGLDKGEMEKDGGKSEWTRQVELVPPNEKVGVSSTKIRRAAKEGDWEVVRRLCTPGVAEWVERQGLYAEDATGAKMA